MQQRAIPARSAWDITVELLQDERIDFWNDPAGLDEALPRLLRYTIPTSALVSDAYLAAFALRRGARIVTFDHGFQQHPGLDVELLA